MTEVSYFLVYKIISIQIIINILEKWNIKHIIQTAKDINICQNTSIRSLYRYIYESFEFMKILI